MVLGRNVPACSACGGGRRVFFAETNGFTWYRCQVCRSLFVWPLPEDALLCQMYHEMPNQALSPRSLERTRGYHRGRLKMIDELLSGKKGRLLEVGCGDGLFLEMAASAGWGVEGVEPAKKRADLALRSRAPIHVSRVQDLQFETVFDCVVVWEVIEHQASPKEFFRRLCSLVAVGGVLVLSTPNATSIWASVLRGGFSMLCPPEHLTLLSPHALTALAASERCRVERIRSFGRILREEVSSRLEGSFGVLGRLGAGALFPVVWGFNEIANACGLGIEFEAYVRKL